MVVVRNRRKLQVEESVLVRLQSQREHGVFGNLEIFHFSFLLEGEMGEGHTKKGVMREDRRDRLESGPAGLGMQ